MNRRKVIVSPYNLGALSALNAVVNCPPILKHVSKMDAENLFYACMIQSGVEEFEIPSFEGLLVNKSRFLSERISLIPEKIYRKCIKTVEMIFEGYLPEGYKRDMRYSSIWGLESFLTDLLLSLERKRSMVLILGVPDLTETEGLIPPEIFYPVQNLLNAFDSETTTLPLPRSSISAKNVSEFRDIITSDLFSQYVLAHQKLDNNKLARRKVISDITKVGHSLFQEYKRLLYLKDIAILSLPVTAKAIDLVFGKLAGILAGYAADQLNNWLKNEKRIILYDFHPKFLEIILRRVRCALLNEEK